MSRALVPGLAGIVFCLGLPGLSAASGGGSGTTSEQAFLMEQPLVLTPSRLLQPVSEAPAAVTVIDHKLIEATGYRDLARLLRLVPGMQVGQERGHAQWVTYHGMGNDFPSWMQVLIDGRSVFSPGSFGGVDWSGLPISIDEIDRIEIVRGTHSVAYGANAFLGVINIITRHSVIEPGARIVAHAGGAGILDTRVELGKTLEAGSFRLNAGIKRDDGFAGLYDAQSFRTASLRADRRIGANDELMLRLATSSGRRQLGYPDSTYGNNAERISDSSNATLHVQWRHTPMPEEEWLLHYYHNQDEVTEQWMASATLPGPVTADVPLDRNRRSMRNNLELQYRRAMADTLNILGGMELRQDRIHSPFLYYGAPRQQSVMVRLFGQADWRFQPDWQLNASLLAEKTGSDRAYFSPRLFANWQMSPRETLRLGYARAWRQPTFFERDGDVRAYFGGTLLVHPYLPNPNLRPARMDSVEMGYLRQFQTWNTRLDLRLFNERITDYITRVSHPAYTLPLLSATLPSACYENLGDAISLRGLEYQLDSRPAAGTRLLFSHSLIGRHSSNAEATKLTAPYSASLGWIQEWGARWNSTLTLLRMGPLAGGTGFVSRYQYVSRAYTTLDANLSHTTRVGGTPLKVALTATNLGGRHQEVADRSEQFLHGTNPVNRTTPMLWLSMGMQIQ